MDESPQRYYWIDLHDIYSFKNVTQYLYSSYNDFVRQAFFLNIYDVNTQIHLSLKISILDNSIDADSTE